MEHRYKVYSEWEDITDGKGKRWHLEGMTDSLYSAARIWLHCWLGGERVRVVIEFNRRK